MMLWVGDHMPILGHLTYFEAVFPFHPTALNSVSFDYISSTITV